MLRYVGILYIALLSVCTSGCGYGDDVPGVCEDGTYQCNSGNVERCGGEAWILLYACAAETICQNGYCPPSPDGVVPIDPCSPDADIYEEWSWEDISGSNDVQTGAYTVWWYDDPCASAPDPVEATLHFAGDVDWYRWNIQASQAGCDIRPTFTVSPSAPDYRVAFYARCYWGDPTWAMGAGPRTRPVRSSGRAWFAVPAPAGSTSRICAAQARTRGTGSPTPAWRPTSNSSAPVPPRPVPVRAPLTPSLSNSRHLPAIIFGRI